MNTFVIKSARLLSGQCIGRSEKDQLHIYIYRSHQVFKTLNPKVDEDYITVLEGRKKGDKNPNGLSDEFDFAKNNICPHCGGLGAFYEIPWPKRDDKFKSQGVCYDEDEYVIFGERVNVYCTCNDVTRDEKNNYVDSPVAGTYVGHLRHVIHGLKRNIEDIAEINTRLQLYIMETSTCQTCHGHSETMYEYEHCKECGLPGSAHFIMGG